MLVRSIQISLFVICTAAAGIANAASASAGEGKPDPAEARYQSERASCSQLPVAEDRGTCLREAAAARGAARQGQLSDANNEFERNALARCNALPQSDREMCIRRTRGEGVVKGSVSEGGIYREYREIIEPGTPPSSGGDQPGKPGQ